MEREDELYAPGSAYDFGARMYDGRLGRWWSVDPLAGKYPSMSAYCFALNSPNLFKDPNGKEAVITIQRNENGGGKIVISSIVYVTGAEATPQKVIDFNKELSNFNLDGTFIDENGDSWDVEVSIAFEYAENKSVIDLEKGENVIEMVSEERRSHVTSGQGGKIIDVNPETGERTTKWVDPIVGNSAQIGVHQQTTRTLVHESLHLFGLSDRYTDVPISLPEGRYASTSVAHYGFKDDIMATGTGMSQHHINNWANYALNNSSASEDSFILTHMVDVNVENGELIPRSSIISSESEIQD